MWAETGLREVAYPYSHESATIAVVHWNNDFLLEKLLYRGQVRGSADQRTVSVVNVVRSRHLAGRDRGFAVERVLSKQTMISGHGVLSVLLRPSFPEALPHLTESVQAQCQRGHGAGLYVGH